MGKLMLDSVLDADGQVVDQSRGWCLSMGTIFHRLSPHMAQDVELDEKDEKVLVDLVWSTMVYMHSKREELKELQSSLVL